MKCKCCGKEYPRINNIDDLMEAAKRKESVFTGIREYKTLKFTPHPAAFALNYNAYYLHGLIKRGLYIYKSKAVEND